MTNRQIIAHSLAKFFKDEPEKITLWLFAENLNFGGLSPAQLILIRDKDGEKKVVDFILSAQEVGAPAI